MKGRGKGTPRSLSAGVFTEDEYPHPRLSSDLCTYTVACSHLCSHMWKYKHTHHSNVYRLDNRWTPNFLRMTERGRERVGEPHILTVPCLILSGNAHDLVSLSLAPLYFHERHAHFAGGTTAHLWSWSPSSKFKALVTESENQISQVQSNPDFSSLHGPLRNTFTNKWCAYFLLVFRRCI